MNLSKLMAKHCRELYFGNNWTASNIQSQLKDVSWEHAITKVGDFNTIATLAFHINYYISAALKVFEGQPLDAKDELSFNHPPIQSEKDWELLKNNTWAQVNLFADYLEQLPDSKLEEAFTNEKYGNYYRNLQGIIEHGHYHLGQIVLLKKMIRKKA